jgi:hypothetical protein
MNKFLEFPEFVLDKLLRNFLIEYDKKQATVDDSYIGYCNPASIIMWTSPN